MTRPIGGANAAGYCRSLLLSTAIITLIPINGIRPASAQSVTGSGVDPGPIQTPNWTVGGDLTVGSGGAGSLAILGGGTVSNANGIVGSDGSGTVTVSGANSWWKNTGRLDVGLFAAGALQVDSGAKVSAANVTIGSSAQGDAVVTGAGTTLTSATQLTVGSYTNGILHIENGASVISAQGFIGASPGIGGQVFVTGPGSNWWVKTFNLTVGNVGGTGTLTIDDGALVRADGGLLLGSNSGASAGTLNLNGTAAHRGVLETQAINAGSGTANFTFNGGLLRPTFDNPVFFQGFGTKTIAIGANGAVIDTNGHNIGISPAFVGSGDFLKTGLGMLTLTGVSTGYIGIAQVDAGTLAVNGTLGGNMLVDTAGRLTGTGQVGATTNTGVIAPGYGGDMGTLTVHGNYTSTGGRLEIATALGDDNSPTSRLVVNGATSGTTQVNVINRGGLGAQTVQGIKIVEVTGASNGSFALDGNYVFHGAQAVIAGAYAYRLYQGGTSTATDGDWYLRSALIDPGTPSGPGNGNPNTPLYQPGVPLYEALPQVLFAMNGLPTLQQRVGNRYWGGDVVLPAPGSQAQEPSVFWGRIEGSYTTRSAGGGATYSDYNIGQWSARTGIDGMFYENADGRLFGGLTAHYGLATADVRSLYGNGSISTTASGFGATATWIGATGFYVDSQAQVTFFDSNLRSDLTKQNMAHDNGALGYAFSIETGKRFGVNGPWTLTPQTQLIYSAVHSDFADNLGANVSLGGNKRLTSRFGTALEHKSVWRDDTGKLVGANVYGIANVYYEFLGTTPVTVSGVNFASGIERVSGGFGFGGTYNWENNKYALYGEAQVRTAFNGDYSIAGQAGLRVTW